MANKTIAVMVVRTDRVFSWLGHMPILNWSLTQLQEARGLHQILCVAHAELVKRCKELLVGNDVEVCAIPTELTKKDDKFLDKWLASAAGPAADADVIVLCKPTAPFLPAAKVEACANVVRRKQAATSCTAQEVQAFTDAGRVKAYVEMPGCRAFTSDRVLEKAPLRFKPVLVNTIEALDISDPVNHRLAATLVVEGQV